MASLCHNSSIKGHPHLMLGHLHSLQNHRLKVLLFVLWKERGELSDCISDTKLVLCHEGCAAAWLGAAPRRPWPSAGQALELTWPRHHQTTAALQLAVYSQGHRRSFFKDAAFRQSLSSTMLQESECPEGKEDPLEPLLRKRFCLQETCSFLQHFSALRTWRSTFSTSCFSHGTHSVQLLPWLGGFQKFQQLFGSLKCPVWNPCPGDLSQQAVLTSSLFEAPQVLSFMQRDPVECVSFSACGLFVFLFPAPPHV